MLRLTRLIEEYLTIKTLRKQPDRYLLSLTDAFKTHKLDKLLFRQIEVAQNKLQQEKPRDFRYHYHQLQWQRMLYFHPNRNKAREQVEQIMTSADFCWLLTRLRTIVEARIWGLLHGDTNSRFFLKKRC